MKIIVKGNLIETKEIYAIKEAGSRQHGFTVHLIKDGKAEVIGITEDESYNMTNNHICNINDRYRALKEKVIKEWEKDKTEFTVLDL